MKTKQVALPGVNALTRIGAKVCFPSL